MSIADGADSRNTDIGLFHSSSCPSGRLMVEFLYTGTLDVAEEDVGIVLNVANR